MRILPLALLLPLAVYASSGDRNPTFQHCLKGCALTYCDPSQAPIPLYLRAFGWDCADNCKYSCLHSFTDNIRSGGRWHQFYGKWPFYRLGPIQEPLAVLFSLGNLYVHLKGIGEVTRRVHRENKLRPWLLLLGGVQINTWIWSAVFHTRDVPITERLDYFSATLTIGTSLLYTLLRVFSLITPTGLTRFAVPVIGLVAFLVLSHITYLLSFPLGRFPYSYHTLFNVGLATVHSLAWIGWTASFYIHLPSLPPLRWPAPYPPLDPLKHRSANALTPALLVLLTTLAMSFELLDFAPILRMLDAHAVWHLCTIPLGLAWWTFLASDAIELEGAMMQSRGVSAAAAVAAQDEKMPLSGGASLSQPSQGGAASVASSPAVPATPTIPAYAKIASGKGAGRSSSPGRSPGGKPTGSKRED